LTHCGKIDVAFIEFIKSIFKGEQLTELSLKDCCEKVNDDGLFNSGILWKFCPLFSLIKHLNTLKFVLLSFEGMSVSHLNYHRGVTYDIRSLDNRKLLLFGTGSLSYNTLSFFTGLHKIIFYKMKELCEDVVNRLVSHSPNLREFSMVDCDASFSKDLLIKITRMPSVESVVLTNCQHLTGGDIEDILCQEGRLTNLKALQVNEQPSFKFVNLLNVVAHNRSLVNICICKCDPALFGKYDSEKSLVKDILLLKNKSLQLEVCYNLDELLKHI
jgi:hypothetical protein